MSSLSIREICLLRSGLNRAVRNFFDSLGYLETETPLLSPDLIPESSIEIFSTNRIKTGCEEELYLVPSPEIWMKKILGKNSGSIYQISKCFRNSEQTGRIHNSEFTMLEWYGVDLSAGENIDLTQRFFKALAPLAKKERSHFFSDDFTVLTMDEAFQKLAGFSLIENSERKALISQLHRLDIPYMIDDNRETLFNRIFLTLVEPELPEDKAVVLTDYPSFIPTLARTEPGSPVSERWELYMGGTELANCYTEETDPARIADYFRRENDENKSALVPHKTDRAYHEYFHSDYPDVSGVALGMDRLLMFLSGADSLRDILLFPF